MKDKDELLKKKKKKVKKTELCNELKDLKN